MNTKRILVSLVTGALLTGSLLAASGNDQTRSRTKVRASKPTATTTVSARPTRAMRTQRVVTTNGNPRYVSRNTASPTRTRVVTRSGSYPYRSYSSYGYDYPHPGYSYAPSAS